MNYLKNSLFPIGHFYSPNISVDEIIKNQNSIWKDVNPSEIYGIDFRINEQLILLNELSTYYPELLHSDLKVNGLRYYFNNEYYTYSDGVILYSIIRKFRPTKIIEIGSGFSSALMLDVNEQFFNDTIKLEFVEPYPERLDSLLSEKDRLNSIVIRKKIQQLGIDHFKILERGDILFIDSSHVSKTGSDVNYLLFEVIPNLKSGVIIHFHDVFYPFEYPPEWVLRGISWNEIFVLRAFLMYNFDFKIILFPSLLHQIAAEGFEKMPYCYKDPGGSLWIEKL